MRRNERDYLAAAREEGLMRVYATPGGKHPFAVGMTASGRWVRVPFPSSPGDSRRGLQNFRHQVARLVRGLS